MDQKMKDKQLNTDSNQFPTFVYLKIVHQHKIY